ncbi:MAG: acetolactate decarboxylase [Vampirovibrionales bacterium]
MTPYTTEATTARAPLNEFTQSCTMGIGTFHALNGELVAFDNQYFHCTQGVCRPPNKQTNWPGLPV